MSQYASTCTPEGAAKWFAHHQHIVVLTHTKPDGDALGSAVALARTLAIVGKQVQIWSIGPWPVWTEAVTQGVTFRKLGSSAVPTDFAPDGVAIVDTGSISQLGELAGFVLKGTGTGEASQETIIIDHHLHGDAVLAKTRLIDTRCASCTEVLAPVLAEILGSSGQSISSPTSLNQASSNQAPSIQAWPLDVAQALFLGLATDTGWMKYSNVTSNTLRLAASLIDSGVNHSDLYELTEQQQAQIRPKLMGLALSSLIFGDEGQSAVMSITDAQLRDLSAIGEDTGGFHEAVLAVRTIRVVASITQMPVQEDGRHLVKVSLRSKPGVSASGQKAVDVAALAAKFGGGGHARAAGIKLYMPFDQAILAIQHAMTDALKK